MSRSRNTTETQPQNELCHLCKKNPALLLCSCVDVGFLLCFDCFPLHFSQPGVHTVQPFDPLKQPASHSNVQCVLCKRSEAAHICICINPPTPLCVTCTEKHTSRMSFEEHGFINVKAFPYFTGPEYLFALKGRQLGAREGKQKLMKTLEQMTAAEKQVMKHFERLIEEIRRLQQDKLQELRTLREQFQALVDSALTEVGDHIYESDYKCENWLSTALWNYSTHSAELNCFTFACDDVAALNCIKQSVFMQIDHSGREDKSDAVLYLPKKDKLLRWDSRLKNYIAPIPLSAPIIVDNDSAWSCTGDGFVFVCGGGSSAASYMINVLDGTVETLHPMKRARSSHGLIVYGQEACVFGGFAKKELKSCEMCNLQNKVWIKLSDMFEPRYHCTPCRLEDKVFLAGGCGASDIECFDWTARTFNQLNLEVDELSSVCLVHDGELIVLQLFHSYSLKLDSNEVKKLGIKHLDGVGDDFHVVVSQGCAYLLNQQLPCWWLSSYL